MMFQLNPGCRGFGLVGHGMLRSGRVSSGWVWCGKVK